MRSTSVILAALLTTSAAFAQEPRQRWPGDAPQGSGEAAPRTAVPREAPAPREAPTPREAPPPPPPAASAPATPSGTSSRARTADDGQRGQGRTAQPRDRRPPPEAREGGVAVPRGSVPVVVNNPTRVSRNYYYYPRRYYPYGYGGFGLGYFYYDPYTWYPYDYGAYRFQGYGYGYPIGELRLQVRPRDGEVYVDGYYAGRVDDFDGMWQALELEAGGYSIEIVAPGFEPIEFDVRIQPGRKVTYRNELRRLP